MSRTPSPDSSSSWALLSCLALLLVSTAGCGRHHQRLHIPELMAEPQFTQVNMRPDEARALLYSANYQRDGFIPLCTEVVIKEATAAEVVFTISETGRTYRYVFHAKSLRDPHALHLTKVFGPECVDITGLSPLDQEGIARGQVLPGMSKLGVILAIGYPPDRTTPDLAASRWMYWISRFNRVEVQFDGDFVERVVD